ncbi:hypothetical protein FF38_05227 [Lucilia cuprina]|uniref:Gustatory receptor n=1 Tax=Lucilia cuprina TaxID=7375 RepID=A0A0L0CBZ9_LUCCU|nr:hypothetical protein CVS40_9924 [Lucilia cuprina]KNC29762.1 hypothetical protein FF38_05227 [Lucilia cuprina]
MNALTMLLYNIILLDDVNFVEHFCIFATHFSNLSLFVAVTLMRIKGDRDLKKWLEIIQVLHTKYIDKLQDISADKNVINILILNIIIMMANSLANLVNIGLVCQIDWYFVMQSIFEGYLYTMQHYMIFHHGLLLSYINHCFTKLNNQLQHEEVKQPFANVYYQLSTVMQEVNVTYGPVIFIMLMGVLLLNIIFVSMIMEATKSIPVIEFFVECLYLFTVPTLSCLNTYLYFLICDRIYETTEETKRIILEFVTRAENQEVCNFDKLKN